VAAKPGRLVERVRRKRAWMRRQRHGLEQYPSRYLNWMSFANAGMLHAGQRFLIDRAISQLPTDDPVVEIGAFAGLSTNVLIYFLTKHGKPNALYSTDPWVFEGEGVETLPEPQIPFDDYRRLVQEQFERNVRFWSGSRLPHAYALASDEFGAFPQVTEVVRQAIRGRGYELVGENPHHLLRRRLGGADHQGARAQPARPSAMTGRTARFLLRRPLRKPGASRTR